MKMRWRERIKGNRKHRFPYFSGSPTDVFTELFCIWDHFPIHHIRRNQKPIIAIGHKPQKKLVTQKLHHPNYLKRALYYQELLDKGYCYASDKNGLLCCIDKL